MAVRNGVTVRGVSNGIVRGSAEQRRRRKDWLLETYASDRQMIRMTYINGKTVLDDFAVTPEYLMGFDYVEHAEYVPTTRCYKCGCLLTFETLTVDRIVAGCQVTKEFPNGGTYRRSNIRPACGPHNSSTGGALAKAPIKKTAKPRRGSKAYEAARASA
jgi:hypothetical protein